MPEMLWAVLLTEVMERDTYLDCFRHVTVLAREWFKQEESGTEEIEQPTNDDQGINFTIVVDHTKLAAISDDRFEQFISILLRPALGYAALRPLLLIEALPGLERWRRRLSVSTTEDDWNTLARAVAGVLDHQSEASTDIRWFKVMVPSYAGRLQYPRSMADHVENLRLFPNRGDMRQVRPQIRSTEMMLRRTPSSEWIEHFWTEIFEKTQCFDPSTDRYRPVESAIDQQSLYRVRSQVISRFEGAMRANRVDPRLDSSFGLVLYSLAIAEEIRFNLVQTRIIGRVALRAIVEANITLRYLFAKDNDALWLSYRVYGAGQAKLAFLKAQEFEGELPSFMDEDALYAIANEDKWQEFLDIDVGHWANSNLRKLATESGAKELYDKYYDWSSTYVHGHWGAVRDSNFVTCHNPLHRLHRIPRVWQRRLNSVESDVIGLINQMLEMLDDKFAGPTPFDKLTISDGRSRSTGAETSAANTPDASTVKPPSAADDSIDRT